MEKLPLEEALKKISPLMLELAQDEPAIPIIPSAWKSLLKADDASIGENFEELFDKETLFELYPIATPEELASNMEAIISYLNGLSNEAFNLPDFFSGLDGISNVKELGINIQALEVIKGRYFNIALSFHTELADIDAMFSLASEDFPWAEGVKLGLALTFK